MTLNMTKFSKLPLLLDSIRKSPSEFRGRLETALEVRWDRMRRASPSYQPVSTLEALGVLEGALRRQVRPFFQDTDLNWIETEVSESLKVLTWNAPFSLSHNADVELGRFCFAVCRALAPAVIVETGVAYGVTSSYLLQAIELNGRGELWSVDLPPLGRHAEEYVGFLVPKGLRQRWNLRRGVARRLLPKVLRLLGQIDVFVQDSLHTYRSITNEINMVWPFLKPGGLVIADDVGNNRAFGDLAQRLNPSACVVIQELHKDSMFGILVKSN
jgi:predicted O-methyltransferase YrrM